MSRYALLLASATTILCITGTSAYAGLSQSLITAPGGFVQAGASSSSPGSSLTAGGDLFGFLPAGADLHEQSFSGNANASTSAAFTNGSVTNSANGLVGLGMIKLSASNTAPNNSSFAMAAANGGWNETMTVNDPALTGQQGFAQVQIQVYGTLNASGFAGSSSFWITGYRNHAQLDIYGGAASYMNRGNSDAISTDRQQFVWSVASYGTPDARSITDLVTFAVPVTFGQPFTLGIYGYAAAGMRSSSGVPGSSSSSLDFSHSLYWGGISNVVYSGSPVPASDYTVTSASGINWANPIPEPASAAILLLAPALCLRRPGRGGKADREISLPVLGSWW